MLKSGKGKSHGLKPIFVTALTISLAVASSAASLAQKAPSPTEEAAFDSARHLFEEYKRLDQACDPKLVDLYAAEARIESDIERKDMPTEKEKYDRDKYCALITKTFADPALAKISAATTYGTPSVSRELLDREALKVEFQAFQGDTAMKVKWILHKQPSGQWLIVKEHAVTFRKSIGRSKP